MNVFGERAELASRLLLDCLQSAFSLKIRLVLIAASAIANHDVVLLTMFSSCLCRDQIGEASPYAAIRTIFMFAEVHLALRFG